jgi:hypothetical protein
LKTISDESKTISDESKTVGIYIYIFPWVRWLLCIITRLSSSIGVYGFTVCA